MARNLLELPPDLAKPDEDGAALHLTGESLPDIALFSHQGRSIQLREELQGKSVLFAFPRAGNTIRPNPSVGEWDLIPGARGCTPQSCGYRDLSQDFLEKGCKVFGLSTQTPEILNEVATKNHLPFELLSDSALQLTQALRLPTFVFHGETLIKRLALVISDHRIVKVFYPVFPPDRNAAEVLAWMGKQG